MDEFDKKDAPGSRIVFFDDEETWSLLSGCWVGYPNKQQQAELEAGSYPKHLSFVKEPLEQLLDPIDPPPDGKEAEELRAGIERLIEYEHGDLGELRQALRNLLDRVDARDSLGYLQAKDKAPKPAFTIEVPADTMASARVCVAGEPVGVLKHVMFDIASNEVTPTCLVRVYDTGAATERAVELLASIPWMTIEVVDMQDRHVKWVGRPLPGITEGMKLSCHPNIPLWVTGFEMVGGRPGRDPSNYLVLMQSESGSFKAEVTREVYDEHVAPAFSSKRGGKFKHATNPMDGIDWEEEERLMKQELDQMERDLDFEVVKAVTEYRAARGQPDQHQRECAAMGFDRYLADRKKYRSDGWFHQAIIEEVRLAYQAGRKSVLGDLSDDDEGGGR